MVAANRPVAAGHYCCRYLPSPSSSSPPLTSDDDDGDGGGGGDDGWRNSFSSSFSEFCTEPCLCFAQFLITEQKAGDRKSIAQSAEAVLTITTHWIISYTFGYTLATPISLQQITHL